MNDRQKPAWRAIAGSAVLALTALTACSSAARSTNALAVSDGKPNEPIPISLVVRLVGDAPSPDNEVEKQLESYTHTNLQFQWMTGSSYDDKVNILLASGELPTLLKVTYNPTIVAAIQSDMFWEIGPYLKEYKNLSAPNGQYYRNIMVNGKLYGVPLFRDLGRAVVHYRKDWFDKLHLSVPKTLDDWYAVIRALGTGDPDGDGRADTYGIMLDKRYNQDTSSILTRLSVTQGGPNKWKIDNGRFIPEFETAPFFDTMKLFRRLYVEGLVNPDFAVVDAAEIDKHFEQGQVGMRISGGSAQTVQDQLVKSEPQAVVDVAPLEGPGGRRVPGESGNAGFLAIPKVQVKSVGELKVVLDFLNRVMDEPMAKLLVNGIEGKHYANKGDHVEVLDRDANIREVKPYRDTLPHLGDSLHEPSLETELARKNRMIGKENESYIVVNPALTLSSATYSERGQELEQRITDAETKFIMGKLSEAEWKAEIAAWRRAGGEQMADEYRRSYESSRQ